MPAREEAFPAACKAIPTDPVYILSIQAFHRSHPFRMQSMRKTGILKGHCPLSGFPKGRALWPISPIVLPHIAWVLTCRPPSRVMR